MRQQFVFQPSKLDRLHEHLVFFFEAIYYQSLTTYEDWDDSFIHSDLKPIYSRCKKLRELMEYVHLEYLTTNTTDQKIIFDSAKNSSETEAICNSSLTILYK